MNIVPMINDNKFIRPTTFTTVVIIRAVQSQKDHTVGLLSLALDHTTISRLFRLLRRILQVRYEIGTFVGLLQPGEHHFCARDVFLWIFEVLEEGILIPCDTLIKINY